MSDNSAIVIDNGAFETRTSIADKFNWKANTFPTIVAEYKSDLFAKEKASKFYIGIDAVNMHGTLKYFSPIQSGTVVNVEMMTKIW